MGPGCTQRNPTDGFAEQNGRDAERADCLAQKRSNRKSFMIITALGFVAVAEAVELVGNRHAYGAVGKWIFRCAGSAIPALRESSFRSIGHHHSVRPEIAEYSAR